MNKIWFSSDWHFGHDREFIWRPRGFSSIIEHDTELIKRHNSLVNDEDDVYVLGDLTLGDITHGKDCIQCMKGKLHIILGNHCTTNRQMMYQNCHNIVEMKYADLTRYNGYRLFLCHYPVICSNFDDNKLLRAKTINLCGHTHTQDKFLEIKKGILSYHVEVDAHDCKPINIDNIISDLEFFYKTS